MKYILNKRAIATADMVMEIAAEEAKKSTCKKSQGGAVIVKDGEIIERGYNKPLLEELCCLRENIQSGERVELCTAIHAEQMAILNALKEGHDLEGARMYYMKIKNGKAKPSGKPSCTVCSRLIYESGIAEVVLWHKDGYVLYSSKEFNELSFKYFLEK